MANLPEEKASGSGVVEARVVWDRAGATLGCVGGVLARRTIIPGVLGVQHSCGP